MILHIDTTNNDLVAIAVKDKNKLVAVKKFKSHRTQAEKLLPAIKKLLKANKLKLSNLGSIEVENSGGSFTSLRIGVVTANALGYALGIPVIGSKKFPPKADQPLAGAKSPGGRSKKLTVVEPIYDREPEITAKKSLKLQET